MELVPLPLNSLRLGQPVPFVVRNAEGRLLLASGQILQDGPLVQSLMKGGGWVQAHEVLAYQRALVQKADTLVHQGAAIRKIAAVQADFHPERAVLRPDLGERAAWADLQSALHGCLRDRAAADFAPRLEALRGYALARLAQRPDASLMLLVHECGQADDRDCRALLGLLVADLAAQALAWPDEDRAALGRAALLTETGTPLLQRIESLTHKLSAPASAGAAAMRSVYLGAQQQPDEAGAALVKALGLYPPGSFVRLASGEEGIVIRRGASATEPVVAALVGKSGNPLGEPVARDTRLAAQAVSASLAPRELKLRVNVEKLLKLYQL